MQKIVTNFWLNLFKFSYTFLLQLYPITDKEKIIIENLIKTIENT